jgi:lipoprotein-anchoring transpeptidase ErfK/SrfK
MVQKTIPVRVLTILFAAVLAALAGGCVTETKEPAVIDTTRGDTTVMAPPADTTTATTPTVDIASFTDPSALPVTLPVIDAFLQDSTFATTLRTRLGLSDAQIDSLRQVARQETMRLREPAGEDYSGSTGSALMLAQQTIERIIGPEKALQLAGLIREQWLGASDSTMAASPTGTDSTGAGTAMQANAIPRDTRVVVNAPAYRMDLFENGTLVKSYKVAIGYPEFPLPTGMRRATTIIFNPTWTPPDEPWVEASNKVKVGEKIAAGSRNNPLGLLKIPIGLPSLIHGGKSPAKLGNFGSHGCVGLTDQQVRDFALYLAQATNTTLSDTQMTRFAKTRTETQNVQLAASMPVELRYETIVVSDGKLTIYRDVYDRNTNTEANLQRVLSAYGVTRDQLTEPERTKVMAALTSMARDAGGRTDSAAAATAPGDSASAKGKKNESAKITRTVKGAREMTIPIAALAGKGYPAPLYNAPPATKRKPATTKSGTI